MTKTLKKSVQKGWKASFNTVLKQHNRYHANGTKVASYATQQQRKETLLLGLRALREMGFKFKTVYAFRGTHMTRLMQKWESEGRPAATLQNRLSVFRTFSKWIDKPGMILSAEHYVRDPNSIKRSYSAKAPKTWDSKGVDAHTKINAVRDDSERTAEALALQRAFGLRSKESLLLRPHLSDKGNVLVVTHGTKGGRTRYVPIDTDQQRALLDQLKTLVKPGKSLVPGEKTYVQGRNAYYYQLRKHGISRKDGITAHGLRHEHLNELYEQVTGHKAPVLGGELRQTDKDLDSLGRKFVSERAGHGRESIAAAYIGGKGGK